MMTMLVVLSLCLVGVGAVILLLLVAAFLASGRDLDAQRFAAICGLVLVIFVAAWIVAEIAANSSVMVILAGQG